MAREKHVWIEKRSDWDCVKVTKMWDTIYPEFELLYCQTKRKKQINYATVYRRMTEANANAFHNPRNQKETRQQQQAAEEAALV